MKFIYIKKELSPKIFNNQKNVKAIIRKKLIDLAYMYLRTNNLKDIKVLDIRMVGSLCNYNYNASSDLDLHITVDYSKISNNKDFVFEFCKTLRKNWSQNNKIKIYGFPVEIFIEDKNVPMNDKGIYSLLKNKWLHEPTKISREKINLDDIKSLYIEYKRTIRDLLKTDDINEYNKFSDDLAAFRKKGLSSEKGEYSDENIVFKLLRKYKKLDLITNRKNNLLRKKYTLKENYIPRLSDIYETNEKNKIDIHSLNDFLLEKGDDLLDVLLQIEGFKVIDYSNEKVQDHFLEKALWIVPKELWNYYSFCEKIIKAQVDDFLKYIPKNIENYSNLVKLAINKSPYNLSYLKPEDVDDYYSICKIAVNRNGRVLYYVDEKFKDFMICLVAIREDALALESVPKTMDKSDYESLVTEAFREEKYIIEEDWFPVEYIPLLKKRFPNNEYLQTYNILKEYILKEVNKLLKESVDFEDEEEFNQKLSMSEMLDLEIRTHQIDLDSLNNFLLKKGDNYLDVLLQVNGCKQIDYSNEKVQDYYITSDFVTKITDYPDELFNYYYFCDKIIDKYGLISLKYIPKNVDNYYTLFVKYMKKYVEYVIHYNYHNQDWFRFPKEYIPQLKKDFPEEFKFLK
jgi:hypothetical protein